MSSSSSSKKKKSGGGSGHNASQAKLRGKAIALQRQSQRENEAREIQTLMKRIQVETPPQGSNPLTYDDPRNSFTPSGPPTKEEIAEGEAQVAAAESTSSTAAAAASSSNKEAKAAKRASTGTVLYSSVRTFSELPISTRTRDGLTAGGFTRLTDIQRAAIPHALAGRDILGSARTGSGKTLAYLVPVVERLFRERWSKLDGIGALIIVPTRELAMQIFDVLRLIGKLHRYSVGLVIGGKSVEEEQERILGMNILICTPGRILHHFEGTYGFSVNNLLMLVLDEADRILDMGFQGSMNDIIGYLPKTRQTLLFSATQTKNIKELAKLSLQSPEYIAVHDSAEAAVPKKLIQHYTIIGADQKINLLYSYIKTHLSVKSIVFLSSGKQVRFLYEIFRRIRPGIPLMHIHGKMKQPKRMSIYYDYCAKPHALLFCTDLAARGLDFDGVDWVVQFDTPESVATYIHRVGRTARYRSGGKSLLFLLPSEIPFIEELLSSKKITTIKKVKADQSKMKDVTSTFASYCAENTELKYLAQKAFISYIRSVFLQQNKNVFKVQEIPTEELAKSMGLLGTPKIKLPKSSSTSSSSSTSASHKEKNMPHALRELLAEKKDPSLRAKKKEAKKKEPLSQVDSLLVRKNTNVFAESRQKLRAKADDDDEEDEEDDEGHEILQMKRKDHDLDEEDEVSMSEDDDDENEDESEEKKEEKESGDDNEESDPVLRELSSKSASRGPQLKGKSIDEASDAFLAVASARVREHDPTDRKTEQERVRTKHQLKKKAVKRKQREEEKEAKAAAGGGSDDEDEDTDGVVVTLGRDGDDDEDMDGGEDEEDDEDEEGGKSGEESDEDEVEQPKSKKQKMTPVGTIADQEALALRILGAR